MRVLIKILQGVRKLKNNSDQRAPCNCIEIILACLQCPFILRLCASACIDCIHFFFSMLFLLTLSFLTLSFFSLTSSAACWYNLRCLFVISTLPISLRSVSRSSFNFLLALTRSCLASTMSALVFAVSSSSTAASSSPLLESASSFYFSIALVLADCFLEAVAAGAGLSSSLSDAAFSSSLSSSTMISSPLSMRISCSRLGM